MSYGNIKITVLGYTQTGKTCYMVSMYSIMKLGINGFTFSEQNLDRDIDLTGQWEALIHKKTWPSPNATGTLIKYTFDFNYAYQRIMSFEWVDYRGGALLDSESLPDVQNFINLVKQSHCLFICISAEHLALRTRAERANAVRADRMNLLITKIAQTLKPTDDQPFPVAIVITKFDLYPNQKNITEVVSKIQGLFPTFWQTPGWFVSVCPVSLGRNLNRDLKQDIEPINVHEPVAFAIYQKLNKYIREQEIKQKKLNEEKELLSYNLKNLEERNFLVKFWRRDKIKNLKYNIEDKRKQIEEARKELEKNTEIKLLLTQRKMIEKSVIFLNRERFYV